MEGALICVLLVIGVRLLSITLIRWKLNFAMRDGLIIEIMNKEKQMTNQETFREIADLPRYLTLSTDKCIREMVRFCEKRKLNWAIENGETDRYMVTISPRHEGWYAQAEGISLVDLICLVTTVANNNLSHDSDDKVVNLKHYKNRRGL